MPQLTRLFLKTALIYLLAALLINWGLGLQRLLTQPSWIGALGPAYFHFFMVGWVTQLIFGVAHWMFPKFTRTQPRGSDRLMWLCYGCLNLGLLLRGIGEPLQVVAPIAGWGRLLPLSALLQWFAGLLFVINTWPRVKER
jgi:hypothetical protein